MKPDISTPNQDENDEIIQILKRLGSIPEQYPPKLLAARRADFVFQFRKYRQAKVWSRKPSKTHLIKRLGELQSVHVDYPSELLASRRSAYISQIDQLKAVEQEQLSVQDQKIIHLLKNLKTMETGYSADSLSVRRSAFRKGIRRMPVYSPFKELWVFFLDLFQNKIDFPAWPSASIRQASFVVAGLILAAIVGSWFLKGPEQFFNPVPSSAVTSQPVLVAATEHPEIAAVICKDGDPSPLCPPAQPDTSQNLAYPGNGAARPAVTNDESHDPVNVNDGREGSSWISKSPNSWIKIDLGKVTTIDTVVLDTAHLNSSANVNPGQFMIAVALSDVYSDGNSSNDFVEYAQVFNSEQAGFNGVLQGASTITAKFQPVQARYLKITFQKEGAAIDEVRVFMVKHGPLTAHATRKPRDESPASILTFIPTNTPFFATPTSLPTYTPLPTDTAVPTSTPQPTDTPTTLPTYTPTPADTATPMPVDTATPAPTDAVAPTVDSSGTPLPATGIAP